jgi:hypothetical protein
VTEDEAVKRVRAALDPRCAFRSFRGDDGEMLVQWSRVRRLALPETLTAEAVDAALAEVLSD